MANSINWMGNKVIQTPKDSITVQLPNQMPLTPDQITPPTTPAPMPPTTPTPTPTPPPIIRQGPPPVFDIEYIPGYLKSIIGKNVRAEFVIGSSQYADKTGVLIDVGVNYFVLLDVNSKTNIMCDLYSVKFVTVII